MLRRIIAILFIFAGATMAWMILGGAIFSRTHSADAELRGRVASTWGTEQTQKAPVVHWTRVEERPVTISEEGRTTTRIERRETGVTLPIEETRAEVALALEHRRKGLLWYSTYTVDFAGRWRVRNSGAGDSVTFTLPLPAARAVYDGLAMEVDGVPLDLHIDSGHVRGTARIAAGAAAVLAVRYRSQGLSQWNYDFGSEVSQVRDFALVMRTDFRDIDFPATSLSPTTKLRTDSGWELEWRYESLLSGFTIGMVMPERLQPGPIAGRISFFAPVSLLFFFLILFVITTVRGIELHPMNYFFLAASFFAFHLLLAYLVDHISIHAALVIASVISIALVVSYLRIVVGSRFAYREAALAQFIYLVLFSYAFFFRGFTGLAITIGSVVTLFVLMQMTARVQWSELFASSGSARPATPAAPTV